jgi:hypothetical protein
VHFGSIAMREIDLPKHKGFSTAAHHGYKSGGRNFEMM